MAKAQKEEEEVEGELKEWEELFFPGIVCQPGNGRNACNGSINTKRRAIYQRNRRSRINPPAAKDR